MKGLIPNPWLILALAAAFASSNAITAWRFYHTGYAFAEARHTAELARAQGEAMKAAEEASRAEASRLAAEAARDRADQELEDAALHDPVQPGCGLPVDRVRRLIRR